MRKNKQKNWSLQMAAHWAWFNWRFLPFKIDFFFLPACSLWGIAAKFKQPYTVTTCSSRRNDCCKSVTGHYLLGFLRQQTFFFLCNLKNKLNLTALFVSRIHRSVWNLSIWLRWTDFFILQCLQMSCVVNWHYVSKLNWTELMFCTAVFVELNYSTCQMENFQTWL